MGHVKHYRLVLRLLVDPRVLLVGQVLDWAKGKSCGLQYTFVLRLLADPRVLVGQVLDHWGKGKSYGL